MSGTLLNYEFGGFGSTQIMLTLAPSGGIPYDPLPTLSFRPHIRPYDSGSLRPTAGPGLPTSSRLWTRMECPAGR